MGWKGCSIQNGKSVRNISQSWQNLDIQLSLMTKLLFLKNHWNSDSGIPQWHMATDKNYIQETEWIRAKIFTKDLEYNTYWSYNKRRSRSLGEYSFYHNIVANRRLRLTWQFLHISDDRNVKRPYNWSIWINAKRKIFFSLQLGLRNGLWIEQVNFVGRYVLLYTGWPNIRTRWCGL